MIKVHTGGACRAGLLGPVSTGRAGACLFGAIPHRTKEDRLGAQPWVAARAQSLSLVVCTSSPPASGQHVLLILHFESLLSLMKEMKTHPHAAVPAGGQALSHNPCSPVVTPYVGAV